MCPLGELLSQQAQRSPGDELLIRKRPSLLRSCLFTLPSWCVDKNTIDDHEVEENGISNDPETLAGVFETTSIDVCHRETSTKKITPENNNHFRWNPQELELLAKVGMARLKRSWENQGSENVLALTSAVFCTSDRGRCD